MQKIINKFRNWKHQHLLKKSLMENFTFFAVNLSKPFVFYEKGTLNLPSFCFGKTCLALTQNV